MLTFWDNMAFSESTFLKASFWKEKSIMPSQLTSEIEQLGEGDGVFIEDKILQGQVSFDVGDSKQKRKDMDGQQSVIHISLMFEMAWRRLIWL